MAARGRWIPWGEVGRRAARRGEAFQGKTGSGAGRGGGGLRAAGERGGAGRLRRAGEGLGEAGETQDRPERVRGAGREAGEQRQARGPGASARCREWAGGGAEGRSRGARLLTGLAHRRRGAVGAARRGLELRDVTRSLAAPGR